MSSISESKDRPLTIVIVGASGDLALGKILPALFALDSQNLLPRPFQIVGFARTEFSHEAFRQRAAERLTCRYVPRVPCPERMQEFLARCYYYSGAYDSVDAYLDLDVALRTLEGRRDANRLYYLAIPPGVFLQVTRALGAAGQVKCDPALGWARIVIEKPFGRDRASSDELVREMARVFPEDQTYRIDHYLGKEVVQNLLALRFANSVFEPLWNRRYVQSVQLTWSEDIGVGLRGGYFDDHGIIRDVMQNHLLQILALAAMEPPARHEAQAIREEKVRLLRCVAPPRGSEVLIGQYRGWQRAGGSRPSYREESRVRPDSLTPTYAAVRLRVANRRWAGVPFLIRAGKALQERRSELVIRFRVSDCNLFREDGAALQANTLAIRIQPDEAIRLRIMNKVPGLRRVLAPIDLNLRYAAAYEGEIPDAYEWLLLDVLRGDRSLFIHADELAAAWDIFTPVLRSMERRRRSPLFYDYGSNGPPEADAFAAQWQVAWI
jgi:glucose-6-phosphate 1-dehydrogenase